MENTSAPSTTVRESSTPSAPASTPSSAPTATPASTPSAAPATPATALDSLRQNADRLSKLPESSPGEGNVKPPAEGVTPPVATTTPAESEGVKNLRTAYEAFKGKVGWAEGLTKDEVEGAMALVREMRSDPVAFYKRLGTDLTAHPQYAPALAPPPAEEPEPGPDLYSEDAQGNRIQLYSDKQLAKREAWLDKKRKGEIDSRLTPLERAHTQAQTAERERAITEQSRATASEVMQDMRDNYPHFAGKESEAKILGYLQKVPAETRKRIGSIAALHVAYTQFLKHDIFPTLDKKTEDRLRAEFGMKAATSAGNVRPGSGNTEAPRKSPRNPAELAASMAARAAAR